MFETTLRYNNNNNKHPVETQTDYYDSLLIQAHLLAYGRKALPLSLRNLIEGHDISYYIDPMIADFRAGDNFRDGDRLRGWHEKYVEALGNPLQRILDDRPNADASQLSVDERRGIAESTVRFQEHFVEDMVEKHTDKYDPDPEVNLKPKAVIPWHHKIQTPNDVPINREILEFSKAESTLPLKPCLFVTKRFLKDVTRRQSLAGLLGDFDCSECFLWVDNLNKHNTTQPEYERVLDLVIRLREEQTSPHFFYGDYFAYLAAYFGAGGTTHGTLYGEERAEKLEASPGGGGLLDRYYVDKVKDFLKVPAAVQIQQMLDEPLCTCDYCQRHFDDWQDIADIHESDDVLQTILVKHHIAMKWRCTVEIQNNSLDETLSSLSEDYDGVAPIYSRARQISPDKEIDYLPRWLGAVEELKSKASQELSSLSP